MQEYVEYFTNLTKFVYKKEIIDDILDKYGDSLSNSQYTKLIKTHLSSGVIGKSTNSPGRCGYISNTFMKEKGVDSISYYNSIRSTSPNLVDFNKNISFDNEFVDEDCIIQIDVEDVFK